MFKMTNGSVQGDSISIVCGLAGFKPGQPDSIDHLDSLMPPTSIAHFSVMHHMCCETRIQTHCLFPSHLEGDLHNRLTPRTSHTRFHVLLLQFRNF